MAVVVALVGTGCLSKPEPPGGDGFDEDGDGTANTRDRCPHRPGGDADRDSDGDGLGDGCDPEPSLDNTRVFFEGFDDVICGDETLVYCDAGTIDPGNGWYAFGTGAQGAIFFAGDHDHVGVTIGFDILARDTEASYNETGIMLCGAPGTESFVQGVQAIVGSNGGTEYVEYYERTDGQGGGGHAHQELSTLDLDAPALDMEMECELRLPAVNCVLRHEGVTTTFATGSLTRGPGQLGIFGFNIDARIRYVDAVALAPP